MTKHLIIDFETLNDTAYQAPMLDMSAVVFDWNRFTSDKPYSCLEVFKMVKYLKVSVQDQVKNYKGFVISQDTMKFWMNQNKEVQARIAPKPDDLTLDEFVDNLVDFFIESGKIDFWWSRSNTFDPIILERIFEEVSTKHTLHAHLPHHRVMDIRTWVRAKMGFSGKNAFTPVEDEEFFRSIFKEHDSRFDVMADVMRLQAIARAEEDLPMVKR